MNSCIEETYETRLFEPRLYCLINQSVVVKNVSWIMSKKLQQSIESLWCKLVWFPFLFYYYPAYFNSLPTLFSVPSELICFA